MLSGDEVSTIRLRSLFPEATFVGTTDIAVGRCRERAAQCRKGDLFVPQMTAAHDGHLDIDLAVAQGASAVLCERRLATSIPQCIVEDTRVAWGILQHELCGAPSRELICVAIAGTHGKTTMNLLVASMLKSIGGRVAYRNSLGISDGVVSVPTVPTAGQPSLDEPETSVALNQWLQRSVKNKVPGAIIELTEKMLYGQTTAGMQYDLLILTSLRPAAGKSQNPRAYQEAILRQCMQLKEHGIVLYNRDDAALARWIEKLPIPAISYGLDADAEIRAKRIENLPSEQTLMISAANMLMPLRSPLIGDHNARHLLGAVAAGHLFGLELPKVIAGVERLQKIPGHMQRVDAGQPFTVMVDQADTPDRLAVAIHALRSTGVRRILCVADCPKSSDEKLRQEYGRVLERSTDAVVLTTTGKGIEAGAQALAMSVMDGFDDPAIPHILPDRQRAIHWILQQAKPGDAILLAGCGSRTWSSKSLQGACDFDVAGAFIRSCPPSPTLPTAAVAAKKPTRLVLFRPE